MGLRLLSKMFQLVWGGRSIQFNFGSFRFRWFLGFLLLLFGSLWNNENGLAPLVALLVGDKQLVMQGVVVRPLSLP